MNIDLSCDSVPIENLDSRQLLARSAVFILNVHLLKFFLYMPKIGVYTRVKGGS